MANKKPLALYAGRLKEMQPGDTVDPAFVAGGGVVKQVEIDFGALPVAEQIFSITDASAVIGSKIVATVAYDAPTNKDLDEVEMDMLIISAGNATAGIFQMFVTSADGSYLEGNFKINYLIT